MRQREFVYRMVGGCGASLALTVALALAGSAGSAQASPAVDQQARMAASAVAQAVRVGTSTPEIGTVTAQKAERGTETETQPERVVLQSVPIGGYNCESQVCPYNGWFTAWAMFGCWC